MKRYYIFLLFLFIQFFAFSQSKEIIITPDSLKNISFEKFERIATNLEINKNVRTSIANSFLLSAKKQNNQGHILRSLYWLIRINFEAKDVEKKIEELINLSNKNNEKDYEFPAKAYILKSEYLIFKGKSIDGLNEALKAEKLAKLKGNHGQSLLIKKLIGTIYLDLNRIEDALNQFKLYKSFFINEKEKSREYLFSVWMIANIYNKLKKPDLAIKYLDTSLGKISKDNFFYKFLILYKGISYNIKKDYPKSNLYLTESMYLLKKENINNSLATAYFFLGENKFQGEKNYFEAKKYFLKADSLINKNNLFFYDFRENYIRLIEIAKKNNSKEEQLKHLDELIHFDSILNGRTDQLRKVINDKYETPLLIEEKENLVKELNRASHFVYLFVFLFFITFIFSVRYVLKLQADKRKFMKLLEQMKDNEANTIQSDVIVEDDTIRSEIKKADIPVEIVKDILQKLIVFEKNNEFLNPSVKQVDLARQFETNSNYLSKIINNYKGKNFSKYLNDLRIEYAIKKLKSDKKFRNFTIKAIAEETGFNTAESFSKSFQLKTGIQPSYFIKKINEIEKKQIIN